MIPLLAGLTALPRAATAQDLALHADLGIGGKYRTGSWIPVTVAVQNRGSETYHGQIQVLADSNGPQQNHRLEQTQIFAVPATIPPTQGAPQRFTVYARDFDPVRDNFTVQFAEGDRGEGHVAAKIVTSANYHVRPFSGMMIPAGDLFVVGVGSDPAGASFLSGLRLGLRHTSAGVEPQLQASTNPNMAGPNGGVTRIPTLQAVSAQPGDLPDSAAGYRGVDAVLLGADAALDSLSDAQVQALQLWTLSGGRLVVYGGSGAVSGGALPAGLQQFLPARFAGTGAPVLLPTGSTIAGRLIPSGVGAPVILQKSPEGAPLMLSARYGGGSVLMLAYDPTSAPFRAWTGADGRAFWRNIVTGASALTPYVMDGEERGNGPQFSSGNKERISDVVLHVPQLNAPDILSVALFLGLYIIVLVPINYFVLKKLDRREWAWVTIPALVVLVSLGAYGVGYSSKGGSMFYNRATLLETSAGGSLAAAYSGCGVFSSHRASYDIDLGNPTAVAADPGPVENYRGWSESSASNFGGVHYVATGAGTSPRGMGVNMWSMRTFDVQSSVDLGGAIDGSLRAAPNSILCTGSIANHTPYALTHCAIYWNGSWSMIDDFAPGASLTLDQNRRWDRGGINAYIGGSSAAFGQQPTTSADGMKRSLANLAQTMTRDQAQQEYAYYGFDPEVIKKPFQTGTDEALLVGWSTDGSIAGPPLKIDGQTPKRDDVALIVVHIPVR
jgi:hypothetical protein